MVGLAAGEGEGLQRRVTSTPSMASSWAPATTASVSSVQRPRGGVMDDQESRHAPMMPNRETSNAADKCVPRWSESTSLTGHLRHVCQTTTHTWGLFAAHWAVMDLIHSPTGSADPVAEVRRLRRELRRERARRQAAESVGDRASVDLYDSVLRDALGPGRPARPSRPAPGRQRAAHRPDRGPRRPASWSTVPPSPSVVPSAVDRCDVLPGRRAPLLHGAGHLEPAATRWPGCRARSPSSTCPSR